MIYGYARVSTKGQEKNGNSLEAQENALRSAGATIIFCDTFTGTKKHRPELDKLLTILKEGDTLIITKLDRIARSVIQGVEIIESLLLRGIEVNVLNMGLMNNSPTGKLIRNVMLAFAEFERDMIVERTSEGKSIARLNPDFKEGRPKKYSKKQIDHALKLCEDYSINQVAEMTGISRSTILREKRKKN